MTRQTTGRIIVSLLAAALLFGSPLLAEDVEGRFRISFHIGGFNTQDEVASNAANVLRVVNETDGTLSRAIGDPRDDDAVFGELTLRGATRSMLTVQYAANKVLMLEAAVGYQSGDLKDIEMQAEFPFSDIPVTESFNYAIFRIPAGTVAR
jgi:hypothetical protein